MCWCWMCLTIDAEPVGIGAGGREGELERLHSEVSHINVTTSNVQCAYIVRGNSILLQPPTCKDRYFIFTWLPFTIIPRFFSCTAGQPSLNRLEAKD